MKNSLAMRCLHDYLIAWEANFNSKLRTYSKELIGDAGRDFTTRAIFYSFLQSEFQLPPYKILPTQNSAQFFTNLQKIWIPQDESSAPEFWVESSFSWLCFKRIFSLLFPNSATIQNCFRIIITKSSDFFPLFWGSPSGRIAIDKKSGLIEKRTPLFSVLDQFRWINADRNIANNGGDHIVLTPDFLSFQVENDNDPHQSGSYYTNEDATRYLTQRLLIATFCNVLFSNDTKNRIPKTLNESIRFHIKELLHPFIWHGFEHEFPSNIMIGIQNPNNRQDWNEMAGSEYGNTAEIWREVIYRKDWYQSIKKDINSDTVINLPDLFTWNVDITQFFSLCIIPIINALKNEKPCSIEDLFTSISVLDPTCGSGEFLLTFMEIVTSWYYIYLQKSGTEEIPQKMLQFIPNLINRILNGMDLSHNATWAANARIFLFSIELMRKFCPNVEMREVNRFIFALSRNPCVRGNFLLDSFDSQCSRPFSIIIGNPPYLELDEVDYWSVLKTRYSTYFALGKPTVHGLCMIRGLELLQQQGCIGMIVPMALVSTQRMEVYRKAIESSRDVWYANFAWRPAKLFDNVNRALTIFDAYPAQVPQNPRVYTTNYLRWYDGKIISTRPQLFEAIRYYPVSSVIPKYWVPKIGNPRDISLLTAIFTSKSFILLGNYVKSSPIDSNRPADFENSIFYRSTGGLYWKIFTSVPPKFVHSSESRQSSRLKQLVVHPEAKRDAILAILNSDYFWWWYTQSSNLRDLNPSDIFNCPVPPQAMGDPQLEVLGHQLMNEMVTKSEIRTRKQTRTDTGENQSEHFLMKHSKPLLNRIDAVLVKLFGWSLDDLDYIQNYDIKFRMQLVRNHAKSE
jgi:hypothetical protein